jgi:hypothetical protein
MRKFDSDGHLVQIDAIQCGDDTFNRRNRRRRGIVALPPRLPVNQHLDLVVEDTVVHKVLVVKLVIFQSLSQLAQLISIKFAL